MINLSKSGDTIVFEFINNGHYLENGTIEVPVNSLSLVTDSSNMCTFYKADSNDIFISATYDELGKTKAEMLEWFEENMVGGGGIDSGAVQTQIDQSISGFADSVLYDSTSKYVEFYHGGTGGTKVYEFDASDFVIDGMVDDVRIETISGVSYLVIDFNTASGKEDIQIPLTDIFDPSNYYTKTEVDGIVSGKVDTSTYTAYTAATEAVLSGKTSVVNLTQAEYDALVTGGTVDPTVLYNITDATPIDMSQYWTSAQTNSAITEAVSGKQDTLSAGTNITIVDNVISATGGGSITIDPTLDSGSTNAVANSAITETIYNQTARFVGDAFYGYVVSLSSRDSGNAINISGTKIKTLENSTSETTAGLWLYTSTINGKKAVSSSSSNTKDFSLVETSAITSAVTSASTDSEVPSAKAVYDAIQSGGSIEVSSAITSGDTNPVQGGVLYDKFDEVEQVTAAALNNLSDNFDGLKLKKLTQAQYDALSPNYDNNTLYVIV